MLLFCQILSLENLWSDFQDSICDNLFCCLPNPTNDCICDYDLSLLNNVSTKPSFLCNIFPKCHSAMTTGPRSMATCWYLNNSLMISHPKNNFFKNICTMLNLFLNNSKLLTLLSTLSSNTVAVFFSSAALGVLERLMFTELSVIIFALSAKSCYVSCLVGLLHFFCLVATQLIQDSAFPLKTSM